MHTSSAGCVHVDILQLFVLGVRAKIRVGARTQRARTIGTCTVAAYPERTKRERERDTRKTIFLPSKVDADWYCSVDLFFCSDLTTATLHVAVRFLCASLLPVVAVEIASFFPSGPLTTLLSLPPTLEGSPSPRPQPNRPETESSPLLTVTHLAHCLCVCE